MQTIKIDLLKFQGAKRFTSKDGTEHVAIPLALNNVFPGEKGLYCNLTLLENRDGPDQYGNDGFAALDLGKERRLAGEKGTILGNWKHVGQAKPAPATPHEQAKGNAFQPDDEPDIPF